MRQFRQDGDGTAHACCDDACDGGACGYGDANGNANANANAQRHTDADGNPDRVGTGSGDAHGRPGGRTGRPWRHATASTTTTAGGDARAGHANRLDDRADARSARGPPAWPLGRRASGVEHEDDFDDATDRTRSRRDAL